MPADWQCSCGREYSRESDFTRHQNQCSVAKKRQRKINEQFLSKLRVRPNPFGKRPRQDSGPSGRSYDIPSVSSVIGSEVADSDISNRCTTPEEALAPRDSIPFPDVDPNPTIADSESLSYHPAMADDIATTLESESHPGPIQTGPRIRRPTAKVLATREDALPEGPGPLMDEPTAATAPARRVILYVNEKLRTAANRFGLHREYRKLPTRIPDIDAALATFMAEDEVEPPAVDSELKHRSILDIIYPYPNLSSFLFGHWHHKGSEKKTNLERRQMQELFKNPSFDSRDICDLKMSNHLGTGLDGAVTQ
ncbi:hypothetical protein M378DRAFT_19350 [Amanita muscaria Koide BX008]|uniref:Uncharacterized protein n=1 Tax=Amanita muscaria (strain Koide BX008) TaxID=946122 RepID=A0A0C2VYN2_AMAMK|nr:hypothetical protein M378DRAFT_19350 [Amanita muscaria Koide BX008]